MSSAPGYDPLESLNDQRTQEFSIPTKRIQDGDDVSYWLMTTAYRDIMKFLWQLNVSMFPIQSSKEPSNIDYWPLNAKKVVYSTTVSALKDLMGELESIISEAPPDPGPRRFGNISFRKWYEIVESRAEELLSQHLPEQVRIFRSAASGIAPIEELKRYFLGSFGSAQRLDYGTGHELSFLAFIGCIWKLGGFEKTEAGKEERAIVLGVIEPYLHLIRQLILTYTLEPAGSHGVWGLDDHSFIPYIFGSAQLSPPITTFEDIPSEGSAPNAPKPGDVTKKQAVDRERQTNMYFSAIGFIYDVKKGPFWEHSPILFDISGVPAGWAKINKGLIKMYNAEVLSKFPVVQHFPFGSLFRWEKDPDAAASAVAPSAHAMSQPRSTATARPPIEADAPSAWTSSATAAAAKPAAPAASSLTRSSAPDGRPGPLGGMPPPGPTGLPMTRAPWASATPRRPPAASSTMAAAGPTVAPWAPTVTAIRSQDRPPMQSRRSAGVVLAVGPEPADKSAEAGSAVTRKG